MPRLSGKVGVVPGVPKGIGAATAEKLAEEGVVVIVNYERSEPQVQRAVSRIKARGGQSKAVPAGLIKLGGIKKLFDRSVREFGKIDVVVNNAGTYEFRTLSCPVPRIEQGKHHTQS